MLNYWNNYTQSWSDVVGWGSVTEVLVTCGVVAGRTLVSTAGSIGGQGNGLCDNIWLENLARYQLGSAPGSLQASGSASLPACSLQPKLEERPVDCPTPLCRLLGAVATAPLYQLLLRRVRPVPRHPSPLTARAHRLRNKNIRTIYALKL